MAVFLTEIDGQEMDAVYTLDDKLQLQDSNYYQLNGEGTNERVNISESEEKRLLVLSKKKSMVFWTRWRRLCIISELCLLRYL